MYKSTLLKESCNLIGVSGSKTCISIAPVMIAQPVDAFSRSMSSEVEWDTMCFTDWLQQKWNSKGHQIYSNNFKYIINCCYIYTICNLQHIHSLVFAHRINVEGTYIYSIKWYTTNSKLIWIRSSANTQWTHLNLRLLHHIHCHPQARMIHNTPSHWQHLASLGQVGKKAGKTRSTWSHHQIVR